jgi:hypothetical protein
MQARKVSRIMAHPDLYFLFMALTKTVGRAQGIARTQALRHTQTSRPATA